MGSEITETVKLDKLPGYEVETSIITLPRESQKIYGEAYIPKDGRTKHPLIIASHGLGANYMTNKRYYDVLSTHGIAVYSFDFRGGCVNSKSEGQTTDMSVLTEVSDLETVLAAAKTWDWVDANRIAMFGHSQGAFVTAITSARHSNDVHSIIILAPGFSIPDTIKARVEAAQGGPLEMSWGNMPLGEKFVKDMIDYDPYSEISSFKKSVLILHGINDRTVSINYSRKAKDVYGDIAELHEIAGGTHNFSGAPYDEALDIIVDFVQSTGLLAVSEASE